MSQTK